MRRRAFVIGSGASFLCATSSLANSKTTIVSVHCSDGSLDEEAEDLLAGALREAGINTVDPAAIDVTYHERSRLVAQRYLNAVSIDYSSMMWVTTKYHAGRLLTAYIDIASSPLPYGEFTVYNVRVRASYRMFDTVDKRLLCGGSTLGNGKNEDQRSAIDDAIHEAIKNVSIDVTRKIGHSS